jgi:hypothetical protein
VDANGGLLEGACEGLERLKAEGCHLFLWSSCGAEYCRKIAAIHSLTGLFEGFTAKPDIIVDDMPGTCVAPLIYDVQQETSWRALVEKIIEKHID